MSKKYKHTIDKCIKGYKTDLTRKLENLRTCALQTPRNIGKS